MIEPIIQWLKEIGFLGLFTAMFLEGSSLPFPGIAVVLAYGHILPFSYSSTILIAAGMSLVYCLASLIPYFLGNKLEGLFHQRSKLRLQKAMDFFLRYGAWSVAISRPFGIGNYISYVAGMSKMRLLPYLFLTFIGIYPWSVSMLVLGNHLNGSYQAFKAFYQNHSLYFYMLVAIFTGLIVIFFLIKNKRNHSRKIVREGGCDSV